MDLEPKPPDRVFCFGIVSARVVFGVYAPGGGATRLSSSIKRASVALKLMFWAQPDLPAARFCFMIFILFSSKSDVTGVYVPGAVWRRCDRGIDCDGRPHASEAAT